MNKYGHHLTNSGGTQVSYPAVILGMQVLLTGGSWLMAGIAPQAQAGTEADAPVYTSAEYLLAPQPAASEAGTPTAAAAPEVSPAPEPTAPSAVPSSPTPSLSMQAPAPTPPPPSIVSQAPAPVPYMDEARVGVPGIPDTIAADDTVPPGYNSVFVDPTDYSLGATEGPDMPSLVFSERSSNCEVTVNAGQMANHCAAPQVAETPASNGVQVGPVNVNRQGVSVGNVTVVSREFLNEKLRPLNVLRRGAEEYIFPLSIPAPITSLFGWRIHPIYGDHRFHSGTDLAAPMGSPVLATQAGRVAIADHIGGYGLTVILRHGDGDMESRYAHLSRVAVRPGEWVEQGEVVGLVGSTGNSTGPHLHFEVRQLTAQGWVAMDAREILQYGMANLREVLNNPLQALGGSEGPPQDALPGDYPYRPAQPNAS